MKLHLYDKHRQLLRDWRCDKGKGYSAEEVSEMLNHHKSWLGQIERGRLVSIKEEDLIKLLSILLDTSEDEIVSNDCVDNFIYSYDPFYQPKPTPKLSSKINNIIPNFLEKSYINMELDNVIVQIREESNKCDSMQRDTIGALLSEFNDNLKEDTIFTLAFSALPYHLLFKKYQNEPEKLQKIYAHIRDYIMEWIDKEDI